MVISPIDFFNPLTIKAVLKGLEKLGIDDFGNTVSELENFTNSPVWIRHRVEKAQDMWDEHRDDIGEFFNEVGENISEGWDCIAENTDVFLDAVGGFLDSLW